MKRNAGFTLVEIAIVLVVIGLLLGAILAGQEIVTNAQVRSSINEYNSVASAIFVYQDRYRRRPGDDNTASSRWTDTTGGGAGIPAQDGNGDGLIGGDWEIGTDAVETGVFWHHLRNDGLVPGARDGTAGSTSFVLPGNGFGGQIGVQENAFGNTMVGTVICQSGVPFKAGVMVDTRIDDGQPTGTGSNTGGLQATAGGGTGDDADAAAVASYFGTAAKLVMCRQMG
jgi:prepilin-type N-terminal cleavage/methylation domain-containing protein